MQKIKGKDTKPEIVVRKVVYSMGFRYRLHSKDLPGKPDLVFKQKKKAIFVHGCFWHQHPGCKQCHIPKSNLSYWKPKLQQTTKRDVENIRQLHSMGWSTLIIWECETKCPETLKKKLIDFLTLPKD